MLTILSFLATIAGLIWAGWRWFKDSRSSERYEERVKNKDMELKGVKDAINTARKHEAEKANSTDIDNLNGL